MLNFDTNLKEIINTQKIATAKTFMEFNSKKKLLNSNLLNEEQATFIQQLTNTFTFYLHDDGKYMLIVMYYSTTKTYEYLVVDLENFTVAHTQSVKVGKQDILATINSKKQEKPSKATKK